MKIDYYPTRTGYRLTEEGEKAYERWLDDYHRRGGCTCWRSAPCSICHHEGHPCSIEETDEYWELDEEQWEVSRGSAKLLGGSVKIEDWYKQGWTLQELYTEGHLVLKEGDQNEMSRDKIVDKSKESVVNYKPGDRVKIIGNSNCHSYEIGSNVVLRTRHYNSVSDKYYWSTMDDRTYVREDDMEPYSESYTVRMEESVEQSINRVLESIKIEPYSDPCSVTINLCNAVKKVEISGTIAYDIVKETNQQSKGDLNMTATQRRVVNVVLIDPDQGLPVEYSQVHDFGQIVTEDDDATTIQELIMTGDVQAKLDIHNKVRSEQIDLDILRRTGNEVKLQPVKLKNLKWIIK